MNYFTIPAKKAFNQLLRGHGEEPEESESVTIPLWFGKIHLKC